MTMERGKACVREWGESDYVVGLRRRNSCSEADQQRKRSEHEHESYPANCSGRHGGWSSIVVTGCVRQFESNGDDAGGDE